jgi:hypothetical protein
MNYHCNPTGRWFSVVFSIKLTPRYNWNIVESGIKHHKTIHCNLCLWIVHSFLFSIIVTTFIVIYDKLYSILIYMGTYYCELWQFGFKMDNLDGNKMYYLRSNYCNPWQSKYTIKYYMKNNTTLSKQFSNPIKQIVEGGKIDTQYTTAHFLSLVR